MSSSVRPRHVSVLALVVSIGAVLALTACSSDDSGSGDATTTTTTTTTASGSASGTSDGASTPDPCSLLTAADLQSATGVAFGEGTVNKQLSTSSSFICDWTNAGGPLATAQVVIVPGGGDQLDSQRQGAGQVSKTSEVTVAGADGAYQTEEGSIVGMDIGGDFVQVSYIPSSPGNVSDATLKLAETAAANFAS